MSASPSKFCRGSSSLAAQFLPANFLKWIACKSRIITWATPQHQLQTLASLPRSKTSSVSAKRSHPGQQQKAFGRTQQSARDWLAPAWKGVLGLQHLLDQLPNIAALASLLKHCGRVKALADGRLVHAHIDRYGPLDSTFLENCLVQMYGNCGSLQDARQVFDKISNPNLYSWTILIKAYAQNGGLNEARSVFVRMPERDVVSWNVMIAAYAQNGHCREALDLFDQMQLTSLKPTTATFICVLDACVNLAHLEVGCQIHYAIVISNEEDIAVGNALISMYGKCKSPRDSRSTFINMPERDVVSWSALISAYVQYGQDQDALALFYLMLLEKVQPNSITFISVLAACVSLATLGEGRNIHAAIVDNNCEQEIFVGNALISMYGKCGSFHDAMSVFSRMHRRSIITWSALITALAQNGHCKEALDFFHEMQLDGIKPDIITFVCVLDACASLAAFEEGKRIHVAIVENGFDHDVILGNALINMYNKCKSLDHARSVFIRIPECNVVSWSAMIGACAQNGHGEEALDLFCQMQLDDIKPNNITFLCALEACTTMSALEEGQIVHCAVIGSGYEEDVTVGTALVNMYGKCGNLSNARSTFDRILHQNVICWNSMLTAYDQNEHGKEALDLFHQMQLHGCKPNNITFVCVLDACSGLAALEEGKAIHVSIADSEGEKDVVVMNALIDMYGKCGNVHEAARLFARMPQHDVVSWNTMIAAYAQNGYAQEALDSFTRMQLLEVRPDEITFVCILTACSHVGRVEDGTYYFLSISAEYGLTHLLEHYLCMIDLLGRAGQLDEAEHLITIMCFEQASSAWASLLGACQIHGDRERGNQAAKRLFQLDPQNIVPYVVLSNIYTEVGMLEDFMQRESSKRP